MFLLVAERNLIALQLVSPRHFIILKFDFVPEFNCETFQELKQNLLKLPRV